MQKAIEYAVKFSKDGRVLERRWSIGPVLVTSVLAVAFALAGHTPWGVILTLLKDHLVAHK
jgi:hypothetical protein